MMTKKRRVLVLLAVFTLTFVLQGAAQADPWAKLQRGALNTTTGWMELGVQPYHEIKNSDQPVPSAFLGFGKGILAGLQRTGYGLSDALSFPLKPHDRPMLEPPTLFESK